MTDYQKMVAKDHKFVMTIPVIDEKSAIVAILSVDSKKMLGLNEPPDKVFYALLAFSMDIYNIYQNIYKK